jgi:Spy/CpxP family protein refolding chaperone
MSRSRVFARLACVACALALIASSSVLGQDRGGRRGFGGGPPGGGFGRGMDKLSLLRADKVIEELAVSEDQQEKIRAVVEESRNKGRELFSGFRDLSDDQRREMRGKFEALAAATSGEVTGILSDAQNKRLGEIHIQIRGAHSLHGDDLAEQLGLSDEQRQNIDDLVQAEREEQRDRFAGVRDLPRDEVRAKFEEMRAESEKTRADIAGMLLAELNESQAAQFKALQGEAFEFDRAELFGSRGGGRQRGGNRGEGRPDRPKSE